MLVTTKLSGSLPLHTLAPQAGRDSTILAGPTPCPGERASRLLRAPSPPVPKEGPQGHVRATRHTLRETPRAPRESIGAVIDRHEGALPPVVFTCAPRLKA